MKRRRIFFPAIFVALILMLANRLPAHTQDGPQEGDSYHAGSIQQYEHEKDAFESLLELVCENRTGFELHWYAGEYTLYPLSGTISAGDVANYNQIAAMMEELDLVNIIYSPDPQPYPLPFTVEFSFGQTAIVYRLEEPDADEFGLWEALDEENWYFVYYPYT